MNTKFFYGIALLMAISMMSGGAFATDATPCPLPSDPAQLLDLVFPLIDMDGNGVLSMAEYLNLGQDPMFFSIIDSNGNGNISKDEIRIFLPMMDVLVVGGFLGLIDLNSDGLIQFEEVSEYVSRDLFNQADLNGNGVIDCEDIELAPVPPAICPLPTDPAFLLPVVWQVIDLDGDDALNRDEILTLSSGVESNVDIVLLIADTNGDGILSFIEASQLFTSLPFLLTDILWPMDINGDGVLTAVELSAYLNSEQFSSLDINSDGLLDCYDFPDAPIAPGEGEGEGEGEVDGLPCPLPNDPKILLDFLWPLLDADGDGGLSLLEALRLAPEYAEDIQMYYPLVDMNGDGRVSKQELLSFLPVIQTIMPIDYLSVVDLNGNGIIEFEEAAAYVGRNQFDQLDLNGNGVLDCGDLGDIPPIIGEGESEGEPEGDTGDDGDCRLPDDSNILARVIWLLLDAYGNRGIPIALLASIAPDYSTSILQDLPMVDTNHDDRVEFDEIEPFLHLIPLGLFWSIDLNGNGVIEYDEVSSLVPSEVFAGIDADGNGAIDCQDLPLILSLMPIGGGPPTEDDIPGGGGYCPLPQDLLLLLDYLWPMVDVDGNGLLSQEELRPFNYIVLPEVFVLLDLDGDESLSRDEIASFAPILPMMLPGGLLYYLDINRDGVLDWKELQFYVSQDAFKMMDRNRNGVIDCGDLDDPTMPPLDPRTPCHLLRNPGQMLDVLWRLVDADNNAVITVDEVRAVCTALVTEEDFALADLNGDGVLTRDEILPMLPIALAFLDLNGDGVLSYREVRDYISEPWFIRLDRNRNGVLDCEDFIPVGILPVLPPPTIQYIAQMFTEVDANGDGAITLDEWLAYGGLAREMFLEIDLSGDGRVTLEEIRALFDSTTTFGGRPVLRMQRQICGNGTYLPGAAVEVRVRITSMIQGNIGFLRLSEAIPDHWQLLDIVSASGAEYLPSAVPTGAMEFYWPQIPAFPVEFVYRLLVPETAEGIQEIRGEVFYADAPDSALFETTGAVVTLLGEGKGPEWAHSADFDRDWTLSLSELLRVIQLYNVQGYQCGGDTEDGFAPFKGLTDCRPHDGDYILQDWAIDLSELLRMIQIFNAPDRSYFAMPESEDGFAPGKFSL